MQWVSEARSTSKGNPSKDKAERSGGGSQAGEVNDPGQSSVRNTANFCSRRIMYC